MRSNSLLLLPHLFLASASFAWTQSGDLVPVVSRPVSRTIELPAELLPFLSVSLHARVPGYVKRVLVDRGSAVKPGQTLVELSAPEMTAQLAEAESRIEAAGSDLAQAQAQLSAAQSTAARLKQAAETPGAIAENELVLAQKQVEAAQAVVSSRDHAKHAAEEALRAQRQFESYLKIAAPFDGIVTQRFVHPGALVGPSSDTPLLVIEQVRRLRLVVPVPEEDTGAMIKGVSVAFKTPAYPDRTYYATVGRLAHSLDQKTRSMAVELDVSNRDGSLSPGMYPMVKWPVRRARPALFVPKTSVVTTTERTFVVRNRNGRAEWVDVRKGSSDGDLVEVTGALLPGDLVVRRGTDELREGTLIPTRSK